MEDCIFAKDIAAAKEILSEHSEKTKSKFVLTFSTRNIGNEEVSLKAKRIKWDHIAAKKVFDTDGFVPYAVLGSSHYDCHLGKVRSNAKTGKRNTSINESNNESIYKRRSMVLCTKKVGCEAKVTMKDIVYFPDYMIKRPTKSFKERNSRRLRAEFAAKSTFPYHRVILVILPKATDHSGHVLGEVSTREVKNKKAFRAVFRGKDAYRPLKIELLYKFPELGESEILGKLNLATICGSDLHTFKGLRTEATPTILGHEGVIEVLKSRRDGICKGQRLSFHIVDCCTENQCQFCATGLQQKCEHLFKYGHALLDTRSPLNGCFASHIILHKGTHVVPVPPDMPDEVAAPANCACATMVNAVTSMVPRQKKTALIQGAGLLGIYGCALLKESGFSQVFCTDVREERLNLVERFGGIPLEEDKAYLKPNFYDVVIEVCGNASVVPKGMRSIRYGGTYILVGLVHPNSKLDIAGEQIVRKCLTVHGIHNYRSEDLESAINFLDATRGKYPYDTLVSQPYDLYELDAAFEEAQKYSYPRVAVKP